MRTHRMSQTRFYKIWKGMITRCYNPRRPEYKNYGGRGIFVCDRWRAFVNFRDDMLPSYQDHLSIDRIDNNGSYCPENCRWATRKQQSKNKRMHKLNYNIMLEIRARYARGNGVLLAQEFGVTPGVISEIVNFSRNYAR